MSYLKKRAVLEDEDGEEKTSASASKRKRNIVEEDEESEEGEVIEAPREQDDDYDSIDEYDDDGYKGPEDRAKLMQMREIEREEVLTQRFDRKEKRREKLEIRQKRAEQRQAAQSADKAAPRKASATERAATTAVQVSKNKMKELAARRNETKERERERERVMQEEAEEEEGVIEQEAERASPRRAVSEDEIVPRSASRTEAERAADEPSMRPAPLTDLERIRLTRDRLEKWLNEPFFELVVPGCFVRIGIGNHDGKPIYRVAEVVQVKHNYKQYSLGAKLTSKRLELQIGLSRRPFEMSFISNSNFEMDELQKYHRSLEDAGVAFKSVREIEEKLKQLVFYKKEYAYSAEEVTRKVEEEKKSTKKLGNLALRRATAQALLQEGIDTGKPEMVADAEKELKQIEEEMVKEKKREQQRAGSAFRIQDINVRNADFMRQIEEKAGKRDLLEASEISAGRVTATDPFKRLPIRPVIYWNVGNQNEEESAPSASAATGEPAQLEVNVDTATSATSQPSPRFTSLLKTPTATPTELDVEDLAITFDSIAEVKPQKSKSSSVKLPLLQGKRAMLHAAVEIEIDVDLAPSSEPRRALPYAPKPSIPSTTASLTGRATLTVTDYKRRMGIL